MNTGKTHQSHPEIIKRLKRADGHLKSVIQMIEDGKPCLDVAQQLSAVVSALSNAKKAFIEDHLDNCLDSIIETEEIDKYKKIEEFKQIAKYI